MWEQLLAKLGEYAVSIGGRLIAAVLLLVVGLKLIGWLIKLIVKGRAFGRLDASVQGFVKSFVGIALKVLLVITVAAVLGVPMTSMIAVLGSAGLAIGLALQGSLSNLAGGLMILVFKPFVVGDFILVGAQSGTVKSVNIFYTVLATPDNKRVVIPNGIVSNETVVDNSYYDTRRVDLTFSVAYDADIDAVKAALYGLAAAHPLVLDDPAPVARLNTQGDSALGFVLRAWCATDDYWEVYHDLTEQVKERFDAQGIAIPYPQLDVHLHEGR